MARLLTLLLLVDLALLLVALIDCLSADRSRGLPRTAWVVLILLGSPIGAIAWLLTGRPETSVRRAEGQMLRTPFALTAPDDDPEFLAGLDLALKRRRDSDRHE